MVFLVASATFLLGGVTAMPQKHDLRAKKRKLHQQPKKNGPFAKHRAFVPTRPSAADALYLYQQAMATAH